MTQLTLESQKKPKKISLPQKVADQDSSNPLYITIDDIQRDYLPISKKRIRMIVNEHIQTLRIGNKILVDRMQLEHFLKNPPVSHI